MICRLDPTFSGQTRTESSTHLNAQHCTTTELSALLVHLSTHSFRCLDRFTHHGCIVGSTRCLNTSTICGNVRLGSPWLDALFIILRHIAARLDSTFKNPQLQIRQLDSFFKFLQPVAGQPHSWFTIPQVDESLARLVGLV